MIHGAFCCFHLDPEPDYAVTQDALYANDTALVSQKAESLQRMWENILLEGEKYGLELNRDKNCADTNIDRRLCQESGWWTDQSCGASCAPERFVERALFSQARGSRES